MSDEAAFLVAIRAAPADPLPRLVYADWLDERGDPRGEFLRLQQQIAEALDGFSHLQAEIDPAWLNAVGLVYDVVVDQFDPAQRIAIIKLIREFTGIGLADAKALSAGPLPAVMVSALPLNRAFEALRVFRFYASVRLERTANT